MKATPYRQITELMADEAAAAVRFDRARGIAARRAAWAAWERASRALELARAPLAKASPRARSDARAAS